MRESFSAEMLSPNNFYNSDFKQVDSSVIASSTCSFVTMTTNTDRIISSTNYLLLTTT